MSGDTAADADAARAAIAALPGVDAVALARLDRYAARLTAANASQNLVAASTLGPLLWSRHLHDSAQLLALAPAPRASGWVDVGSGAGLPGLVAAIIAPQWPVALVESRKLRCIFLRETIDALGLGDSVTVIEADVRRVPPRPFAVISARAFAPLPRLIDQCRHLADNETRWLLPKGKNAVMEVASLPQTWQHMFHVEHSQTDGGAGIIVGRGSFGMTSTTKRSRNA